MTISIICPYTDENIRKEHLDKSLVRQSIQNYELIALKGSELGLNSAAQVLNEGAKRSSGDILVFVHQDIELLDSLLLQKIITYCDTYEFGIAGVAGVAGDDFRVHSSVVQGRKKTQVGDVVTEPIEAWSCDECFFFVKKERFRGFADLGPVWHLYSVEYSLRCSLYEEKTMLFPLEIYHLSPGCSLDVSYWKTLAVVAKRYRGKLEMIPTVFGVFPIDWSFSIRNTKRMIWTKLGWDTIKDV